VLILFVELVACWFFMFVKHVALVFLIVKLNLIMGFFACWFFFRGTCFVMMFPCETFCILVLLFLKLLHWFFSSWNCLSSWNLLRTYCCSWDLLHVDFSLRKTFTLIFSPRETNFIHGTCCVLILVRGNCCVLIFVREIYWDPFIFPLWNLQIDFFSSWNWFRIDFSVLIIVCGTCCLLIFARETCCMFIFLFVKLIHWFFFLLMTPFLFMELVACWFRS